LNAVELVLRGQHMLGQPGPASLTEAKSLFDAALQEDPNLVAALIGKSSALDSELDIDPDRDRKHIAREMDELTAKALLLDSNRASVWTSRSVALADGGQWSAALEAIDNAIQREPNNPHLYVYKAQWMVFTGRPAEALRLVEQAIALDPDYVGWAMMVACEAHLFLGQSGQAIAKCERAAPFEPNRTLQLYLAAAYGNHGELQKAAAARQLAIPKMKVRTIAQLPALHYSDDPEYLRLAEEYLYPGLAKAGVPLR
jgi:tetratricopeptide (TPR) repeat protein